MIHLQVYVCNWAAQKQADLRQTWVYLPICINTHAHPWSIHNSYVSKMCIQNIANIFAGFWIRACWKTAKSAKINVPRIFPRVRSRPKFEVSFYLYFCRFWINVTQINFENIKRKIQRIISNSCFQLKSWFNVDARALSIPLLNFPFKS